MLNFYSTRQVARLLGLKPDILQKAVWLGRIDPPAKSPSGHFLWTELDIERASWVLLHKAYEPTKPKVCEQIKGTK
jgi:hypothetical protein